MSRCRWRYHDLGFDGIIHVVMIIMDASSFYMAVLGGVTSGSRCIDWMVGDGSRVGGAMYGVPERVAYNAGVMRSLMCPWAPPPMFVGRAATLS